jgi:hypothetical protein
MGHFYDTNGTILELFKEWRTLNKEIPCPLLLGYPMDKNVAGKRSYHVYPAGGPGYTLNRSSLKFLIEENSLYTKNFLWVLWLKCYSGRA